jgi:hypothetical protein
LCYNLGAINCKTKDFFMSLSITLKSGSTAPQLPIHQASAASGSLAEKVDSVTSLFLEKFDRNEFKELVAWAQATVEGRPFAEKFCSYEAHSIMPQEFLARLKNIFAQGGNPKTLNDFNAYKLTSSS